MSGDRQSTFPGSDEAGAQGLPFVVELWTEDRSAVQTVLARVQSISLGQAVFGASRAEFPSRYLTLRRGQTVISHTGNGQAAQIS